MSHARSGISLVVGLALGSLALGSLAIGTQACTPTRPNASTPMGPRPDPEDEATQKERTGARQREMIMPPKAGPEKAPPPPLNVTPPASSSRGAGGSMP
jgi:hypothetical protein